MATLLPALIFPMVIIVMVVVFANFEAPSLDTITVEETGNATSMALNDTTYTFSSRSYIVDASVSRVVNSSGVALSENTSYEVAYTNGNATIKFIDGQNASGAYALVTYEYYPSDAYSGITDTADATYDAFDLATILPTVIIAVAVLSILIGAFVVL